MGVFDREMKSALPDATNIRQGRTQTTTKRLFERIIPLQGPEIKSIRTNDAA